MVEFAFGTKIPEDKRLRTLASCLIGAVLISCIVFRLFSLLLVIQL